jgi:hypothetical protein
MLRSIILRGVVIAGLTRNPLCCGEVGACPNTGSLFP